jgi:uncharacterized membrane-anchored protein YjiN (DUF445 family)
LNKSLITNLLSIALMVVGYLFRSDCDILFSVGLFAFSGGITNWIAIHMLFEKVPFLYGSGVIPNRFEEFKMGIKNLIVQEFFTKEHIEKFFASVGPNLSEGELMSKIDFDHIFAGLVDAIEGSSLGSVLGMVGGRAALDPLKEPVTLKLKGMIHELVEGGGAEGGGSLTDTLIEKVEGIIDNRLEELTPDKVKEIIQTMIRKHLGWLVVWGGVFGGLIGLAAALLQ